MLGPQRVSIPFDIIVIIIKFGLAIQVSIPPSTSDHQLRTSVLLLSHEIRSAFLKEVYNTVILWSADAINKFAYTLSISPSLEPLVLNLWVGNQGITKTSHVCLRNGLEISCFDSLEHILRATHNIQRLYIAVGYDIPHDLQVNIPRSVQHLVLPKRWLRMISSQGRPGYLSAQHLPPNLQSFRSRGGLRADDLAIIVYYRPSQLRITLELCTLGDYRSLGKLVDWALEAREHDPWQFPIQMVSSPDNVEDCEEELTMLKAVLLNGPALEPAWFNVIGQELDDKTQLGIWLSEGEHSLVDSL